MPTPPIPTAPAEGAIITTAWGSAVQEAVFGTGTQFDVRDGWLHFAVAAGMAYGPMRRFSMADGDKTQIHSPMVGLGATILGFHWRINTAPTVGYLEMDIKVGSRIGQPYRITSTTGVRMLATPYAGASGSSGLGIDFTTSSDYNGGATLAAGIILAYNYADLTLLMNKVIKGE